MVAICSPCTVMLKGGSAGAAAEVVGSCAWAGAENFSWWYTICTPHLCLPQLLLAAAHPGFI